MNGKNVSTRSTLRVMVQVSLSELLKRARGDRSLREMARRTGLAVSNVKLLEEGGIALPSRDTLAALAAAYDVPYEDLARAAYGAYYEEDMNRLPAPATPPSMKEPALAR